MAKKRFLSNIKNANINSSYNPSMFFEQVSVGDKIYFVDDFGNNVLAENLQIRTENQQVVIGLGNYSRGQSILANEYWMINEVDDIDSIEILWSSDPPNTKIQWSIRYSND